MERRMGNGSFQMSHFKCLIVPEERVPKRPELNVERFVVLNVLQTL